MSNALHHPHQAHHHVPWSFFVILAIAFAMILTFSLVPSITIPRPVSAPVIDHESAYIAYLQGEKVIYTSPIKLHDALAAYHAGEKPIYANPADRNTAIWAYHIGEMNAALSYEDALWQYRMGEKNAALNLEDALWEYRMGEKGLK